MIFRMLRLLLAPPGGSTQGPGWVREGRRGGHSLWDVMYHTTTQPKTHVYRIYPVCCCKIAWTVFASSLISVQALTEVTAIAMAIMIPLEPITPCGDRLCMPPVSLDGGALPLEAKYTAQNPQGKPKPTPKASLYTTPKRLHTLFLSPFSLSYTAYKKLCFPFGVCKIILSHKETCASSANHKASSLPRYIRFCWHDSTKAQNNTKVLIPADLMTRTLGGHSKVCQVTSWVLNLFQGSLRTPPFQQAFQSRPTLPTCCSGRLTPTEQ